MIFSAASDAQIFLSLLDIAIAVTSLDPFGSFFILNKEAFSADQIYIVGSYPFYPVATIYLELLIVRAVISSLWVFAVVSFCFLPPNPVKPPPKYS